MEYMKNGRGWAGGLFSFCFLRVKLVFIVECMGEGGGGVVVRH